jgi:hypothetical protein
VQQKNVFATRPVLGVSNRPLYYPNNLSEVGIPLTKPCLIKDILQVPV